MSNVLVVVHIADNEVKKAVLCTAAFAKTAAGNLGGSYDILAIGADLSSAKDALTTLGAQKVLLAQGADMGDALAERLVPVIEQVVKAGDYKMVVSPASSIAKDVLPRFACRMGAGMASEVVALSFDGGKFTYVRPMYAGNVNGAVQIDSDIEVVTIRPTEFEAIEPGAASSAVEDVALPAPEAVCGKVEFLGFEKSVSSRPDLAEAAVVASGGRGVKSKENFKLIEDLADAMGGAVGASRAAVDSGFIHNDFQVGQTGKIVAPDLYIAVGISGALQHVAGMKSSKVVVAINKDEEAPIFQIADYGIVADLFKVVPELTAEIKKIRG
ncbi:MAG: electron transfer flavoprotein subunit alpha/FixB family protein [Deltaproteobacteria bacterium]|nr:electron transfer flavoprotein subunit alpha/FixB family protein [Deltaproteobacteria bacterium]MBN2674820.1 electron transfer flavoprotein subunit alpha/FixB family protein [Deltaproteobacteria bacterium]